MTEPALAQLAHQFGQRFRARAEMRIDFFPCFLRRTFDLLRAITARDLFFVRLAQKHAPLEFIE